LSPFAYLDNLADPEVGVPILLLEVESALKIYQQPINLRTVTPEASPPPAISIPIESSINLHSGVIRC
jgi:hypothetical protein